MLYRAFVYTGYPTQHSEATVFFEAHDASSTGLDAALRNLVALAWRMPAVAVEYYNVFSETELRGRSDQVAERGADRDTCLLETGWGHDGTLYADPARTMLLVSPRWHARLLAAQERAMQTRQIAEINKVYAACAAVAHHTSQPQAGAPA